MIVDILLGESCRKFRIEFIGVLQVVIGWNTGLLHDIIYFFGDSLTIFFSVVVSGLLPVSCCSPAAPCKQASAYRQLYWCRQIRLDLSSRADVLVLIEKY